MPSPRMATPYSASATSIVGLLVGDDDQLRRGAQLLHQQDQPAQVDVVQRGLDLVEHVERRRAGPEDRDEQCHGRERPLAARQQRQPFHLLARWAGLHLDAGGEHVRRVGEDQPAVAAREQRREHRLELARHVGVRLGEHREDLVVDLAHDRQQVAAGVLEVFQLGGEEPVALLQGRELLQRERVHPAQEPEVLLGAGGAALLRGAVVGHRRGRHDVLPAFAGGLVLRHLGRRRRDGHVRPVLVGQVVRGQPVVVEHLGGERLQPGPRLRAQHLVAVHGVDELLQQRGEPPRDGAHLGQGALTLGALSGRGVALDGGGRQRLGDRRARRLTCRNHDPGDAGTPLPGRPGRRGPGPGLALRRRLAAQRLGPAGDRAGPLLRGPQREAGLDLRGARMSQRVRGGVANLGVRLVVDRLVFGHGELSFGGLQRQQRVGPLGLDGVAPRPQPLGLGPGRPYGLLQPAELGRGGARPALGGRPRLPGGGQAAQPCRLLGPSPLQRGTEPGQLLLDAVAGGRRLVHRGLHVQRARRGA